MCPAASGLAAGFEIRFSAPITWWTTRNAGEITPHDYPMTLWVEFRYQSQEFARIGACQCEGEPLMRVTPARV